MVYPRWRSQRQHPGRVPGALPQLPNEQQAGVSNIIDEHQDLNGGHAAHGNAAHGNAKQNYTTVQWTRPLIKP